jgi:DNA-binding PadR family transcriptional regulator
MFRKQFEKKAHDMRSRMMNRDGFGFGGHGPEDMERAFRARGKDRFFKKGNLQFVILKMLQDESKHGYQVIKDLEERFKGFYSPSPGSVYPILQMLEDREFVSTSRDGKKKVYTITEDGEQFLADNMKNDDMLQRMEQFKNMDFEAMKAMRGELQELFKKFMLAGKEAMNDDDKKQQFKKFVEQTKADLDNLYK